MIGVAMLHGVRSPTEILTQERLRLEGALSGSAMLHESSTDHDNADIADAATEVLQRMTNRALRRNRELLLRQVDEALDTVKAHAYGICKECGTPIDVDRLHVLPWVTLCIKCQTRQEQTESSVWRSGRL
jgi:RNA polymerase-binding protein DksA